MFFIHSLWYVSIQKSFGAPVSSGCCLFIDAYMAMRQFTKDCNKHCILSQHAWNIKMHSYIPPFFHCLFQQPEIKINHCTILRFSYTEQKSEAYKMWTLKINMKTLKHFRKIHTIKTSPPPRIRGIASACTSVGKL